MKPFLPVRGPDSSSGGGRGARPAAGRSGSADAVLGRRQSPCFPNLLCYQTGLVIGRVG